MAFPSFNEAVNRLHMFLKDNEWPTEIFWVNSKDITIKSQEKAKQLYKEAVSRNLGVEFEGLATDGQIAYISICWPKDMRESELLLFSENDLKISLKVPMPIIIK